MSDLMFGDETGRYFIADQRNGGELVTSIPDHDEWNVYTECGPDEDGAFWYVSDHEGYTLDAEEFGPFTEDDVLTKAQRDELLAAEERKPCIRGTEGCIYKYVNHNACEGY